MYWHNPVIETTVAQGPDIVDQCRQQGHCVFYDPALPMTQVYKIISLQDTCDLANAWLKNPQLIYEPGDIDKIANVVRINQFVHSLRSDGNFKPILVNYTGSWPMTASTGGTRFMAAERCSEIKNFPTFISTHQRYRHQFEHLAEITSLAEFAKLCGATDTTPFYFRLTDADANYGLDWYEVALSHTSVPSNDQCMAWLDRYLQAQSPEFEFSPEWFDQAIDWTTLGSQAAKSELHC